MSMSIVKSIFVHTLDEGQRGNVRGIKRKGRLPSKRIVNSLGRFQTVYYRPDHKSKSQYIDISKLDTSQLLLDYGESFKRMLFRDHSTGSWQERHKGMENQAQGKDITKKLDALVDKYGFSYEKFDHQQESFLKDRNSRIDEFLDDAKNIYAELYSIDGFKPLEFINGIFSLTESHIHTKKGNKKGIVDAVNSWSYVKPSKANDPSIIKPKPKEKTPDKPVDTPKPAPKPTPKPTPKPKVVQPNKPKSDGEKIKEQLNVIQDLAADIFDVVKSGLAGKPATEKISNIGGKTKSILDKLKNRKKK